MNRKILAVLTAILLGGAMVVSTALANTGYGHSDRDRHGYRHSEPSSYTSHYLHHLLRHKKEIGLTEDQVTKLRALSLNWDKTRIKGLADIQVAEREVAALTHDEKTDLAAIESKMKDAKMQEVNLRMAALKTRREALTLLTPDQRQKERAEHETMMSHRGKGGDRGEHEGHVTPQAEQKG
jgi:Spy/CpxP family protein refolding chaperone